MSSFVDRKVTEKRETDKEKKKDREIIPSTASASKRKEPRQKRHLGRNPDQREKKKQKKRKKRTGCASALSH